MTKSDLQSDLQKLFSDNRSGSVTLQKRLEDILRNSADLNWDPGEYTYWVGEVIKLSTSKLSAFAVVDHFLNYLKAENIHHPQEMIDSVGDYNNEWDTAGEKIAAHAGSFIQPEGKKLLLHSNSSTIHQVIRSLHEEGNRFEVIQSESDPAKEGLIQAEVLQSSGIDVQVIPDSYIESKLDETDLSILGADAVYDATFVNKKGSNLIAQGLSRRNKDVFVTADSRKFSDRPDVEEIPDDFEKVSRASITAFITEQGVIRPS